MFGSVVEFRQSHWPPIDHAKPRFSIESSMNLVATAPVAHVNESPNAAMTEMSGGKKDKCNLIS